MYYFSLHPPPFDALCAVLSWSLEINYFTLWKCLICIDLTQSGVKYFGIVGRKFRRCLAQLDFSSPRFNLILYDFFFLQPSRYCLPCPIFLQPSRYCLPCPISNSSSVTRVFVCAPFRIITHVTDWCVESGDWQHQLVQRKRPSPINNPSPKSETVNFL